MSENGCEDCAWACRGGCPSWRAAASTREEKPVNDLMRLATCIDDARRHLAAIIGEERTGRVAARPDEVRLARALETIEELRREVARQAGMARDEVGLLAATKALIRAIASAVGTADAVPSAVLDAVECLVAENNSLKIQLAERDQRLVEAGRTMAGMREAQRVVQRALDDAEHEAVVAGRSRAVDAAERRVVEPWREVDGDARARELVAAEAAEARRGPIPSGRGGSHGR